MDNNQELLSERGVAIDRKVSLGTIQRLRKAGKIKPVTETKTGFGLMRMYDPREVQKALDESETLKSAHQRYAERARQTF